MKFTMRTAWDIRRFAPARLRRAGIAVLAGLLGAGSPSTGAAELACGATVGPGDTVTLTANLGPCDGLDAAIVVDSGTLDLGGFTVSCADADDDGRVPEGIVLVGKKARVRNGTVEGCDSGVEVAGSGKHTVQGIVARNIVDDVFDVAPESRKNRLVGNTASGGTDDGFEVRSDKNKLSDNVAEGNAEDGFDVIRASGNKLLRNRATGNGDSGYDIGGDRNKVTGNAASGNEGTGITVQGMRNRVVGNTSTGNLAADVYSSASCAVNVYRGNTFGTRSPDCIK